MSKSAHFPENHVPARFFTVLTWLLLLCGVLLLALVLGMISVMLAVRWHLGLSWLLLPAAAIIGHACSWLAGHRGVSAAILAVIGTLLTGVFTKLIVAVILLAGSVGATLEHAVRAAGPAMLLYIARLRLDNVDLVMAALAVVIALALVWLNGRISHRPATSGH